LGTEGLTRSLPLSEPQARCSSCACGYLGDAKSSLLLLSSTQAVLFHAWSCTPSPLCTCQRVRARSPLRQTVDRAFSLFPLQTIVQYGRFFDFASLFTVRCSRLKVIVLLRLCQRVDHLSARRHKTFWTKPQQPIGLFASTMKHIATAVDVPHRLSSSMQASCGSVSGFVRSSSSRPVNSYPEWDS
jgi:hypothetical protein